jgi:hypothetical protein
MLLLLLLLLLFMNFNAIDQILTQIHLLPFPDLIEAGASIFEALGARGYSEAIL